MTSMTADVYTPTKTMDGSALPTLDDMDSNLDSYAIYVPTPINASPPSTASTPTKLLELTTQEKYTEEYSPSKPEIKIVKRKLSPPPVDFSPKRVKTQDHEEEDSEVIALKLIPRKSILKAPEYKPTKSDRCVIFADTLNLPLEHIKEIEKIGQHRWSSRLVSSRRCPWEAAIKSDPVLKELKSLPLPTHRRREPQPYRQDHNEQIYLTAPASKIYEPPTVEPMIQQIFQESEPAANNVYTATMPEPESSPESTSSGSQLPAHLKEMLNQLKTKGILTVAEEESPTTTTDPFTAAMELAQKMMEEEKVTDLTICEDSIPMNGYVATFAAPQSTPYHQYLHSESWINSSLPRGFQTGPFQVGRRNNKNHHNQLRDFHVQNNGGYCNGSSKSGPQGPKMNRVQKWRQSQQKISKKSGHYQVKYYPQSNGPQDQ